MKGVERESESDAFGAEEFLNSAPEIAELFDLAPASFGFTGQSVLEKLALKEPLAAAAGIPNEILELLYGRAHLWSKAGHFQRAEQIFQALCMANPQDSDYWAGFGLCLSKAGAWDRALLAYERALALRPDWDVMHVYYLEACIHMKEWDRALKYSELVRKLPVDTPEDLLELAVRYHNLLADHFGHVTGGSTSV